MRRIHRPAFLHAAGEPDPLWPNVVFQLGIVGGPGSTGFIDQSTRAHPITAVGNAQVVTDGAQLFPGGVAWFDGTGDGLSVPTSVAFGFGTTRRYTIEIWGYVNNNTQEHQFLDTRLGADSNPKSLIYYLSNGTGQLTAYDGVNTFGATGSAFPIGAFAHFCMTFDGTTTRAFLNGILQWSTTASIDMRASRPLAIGNNFLFANGLGGRIGAMRITESNARWVTDFIPLRAPFPTR